MVPIDESRSSSVMNFSEREFIETLRGYGVDQDNFAKDPESLFDEIDRGEAEPKHVVFEGRPRLMMLRRTVLIDVTYFNHKDFVTYRLGEAFREFPRGGTDVRFPGEKFLSETIREKDRAREDGFRAAFRCLSEEGGMIWPRPELLLPKRFYDGNIHLLPGAIRLENQALFIRRESKAYPGLLSGSIVTEYTYSATDEDWNQGLPNVSLDEYDVTTYAMWNPVS